MKIRRLALVMVLCFVSGVAALAQQRSEAPLTNAAVIKLVRAGFKEKTVIAIIHSRPSSFDLSPDRLIELKRGGVSENVILAMLASNGTEFAAEDGWSDDPFFNDSARAKQKTNEGETDIFGMSGGSNSRTEQRGAGGSGGDNSQTTGSATIRIIRPPVEPGGKPE